MIEVDRQAILPYTPEQMYRLVSDIEAYPLFLSSCKSSRILLRSESFVEAELCLVKSGIEQCFSTRNTGVEYESIQMDLLEGPFTYLSGRWGFREMAGLGCKVDFHLAFEMRKSILQKMIAGLVVEASNRLVDAICRRAEELYSASTGI